MVKTRDQRISEEAAALWREVFEAPPPPGAGGSDLLSKITSALPEVTYEQMTSHHLRASQIARPTPRDKGRRA